MQTDLRQLAHEALRIAQQNLIADGYLVPMAFLVTADQTLILEVGPFDGPEEKDEAYQRVIREARDQGALAIVTVNDAYTRGPVSNEWLKQYYNGQLADERAGECIMVTVSGPGITNWEILLPYTRTPDGIVLHDIQEDSGVRIDLLHGWADEPSCPS